MIDPFSSARLELYGIVALGGFIAGHFVSAPPAPECKPIEIIRHVRPEPEVHIKEVERIVEKPAACVKSEESQERPEEPIRRHGRWRWRKYH